MPFRCKKTICLIDSPSRDVFNKFLLSLRLNMFQCSFYSLQFLLRASCSALLQMSMNVCDWLFYLLNLFSLISRIQFIYYMRSIRKQAASFWERKSFVSCSILVSIQIFFSFLFSLCLILLNVIGRFKKFFLQLK